jgi:hypothetical protein
MGTGINGDWTWDGESFDGEFDLDILTGSATIKQSSNQATKQPKRVC